MAVRKHGDSLNELLVTLVMLIDEHRISDAALLNVKCMKSLNTFNNVNEMLNYAEQTYCDSIIIKKNGSKYYNIQLYLHKIKGFKLNEKSMLVYLNTIKPDGKPDTVSIKF